MAEEHNPKHRKEANWFKITEPNLYLSEKLNGTRVYPKNYPLDLYHNLQNFFSGAAKNMKILERCDFCKWHF